MSEFFEVITEEEFKRDAPPDESEQLEFPLEWCEFCKGWYIKEFHHGDQSDPLTTDE